MAQDLGIRAMPTFLLYKNNKRIGEVVGANPKALEAAIKKGLTYEEEEEEEPKKKKDEEKDEE